MKKYRVLRDMPFYLSEEIIECTDGFIDNYEVCAEILRENGWIEEVKEESLLDKFKNKYNELSGGIYNDKIFPKGNLCYSLAKLAKDHYLKVFDSIIEDSIFPDVEHAKFSIKKALEEA